MAAKRPASPTAALIAEIFDGDFECQICTLANIKRFRLLPCQHKLCIDCLRK